MVKNLFRNPLTPVSLTCTRTTQLNQVGSVVYSSKYRVRKFAHIIKEFYGKWLTRIAHCTVVVVRFIKATTLLNIAFFALWSNTFKFFNLEHTS